MKQAVLFTFLLFIAIVNCLAQDSAAASSWRRYVTRPLALADEPPFRGPSLALPTWTATTDGYTYQMVGQNPYTPPSGAAATTTISSPIIPVVLTFPDGTVF